MKHKRFSIPLRRVLVAAFATGAVAALVGVAAAAETPGACSGTAPVQAKDVALPTRLLVDRWQFSPRPMTASTTQLAMRVHIADTCGRSVVGGQIWTTAVPYNQVSLEQAATGSDGWASVSFKVLQGFPANPGRQEILAVLVRATKPGDNPLAGVSTTRTIRQNVDLSQ